MDQNRTIFRLRADDMKSEVIDKYLTLGIVTLLDSAIQGVSTSFQVNTRQISPDEVTFIGSKGRMWWL